MTELSYHPLFNEITLNNILKYNDNTLLRLVHPFWNEILLITHGKGIHPWFQSKKTLKAIGSEFTQHLELKSSDHLLFCQYKGIFIYVEPIKATLKIHFVDFTQKYDFFVIVDIDYSTIYYVDFARFHWNFTHDGSTHYLVSLKLRTSICMIDYSNLDNLLISKCKICESADVYRFQFLFSDFYSLNIHPSDLHWFNFEKFHHILNQINIETNSRSRWEKIVFLSDHSIILSDFYYTHEPIICLVTDYHNSPIIKHHTFDLPFKVNNFHFWHTYAIFEGDSEVAIYSVNEYDKPVIQFPIIENHVIKFTTLDRNIVGFSQIDQYYLVDLGSRIVTVISNSPYIYYSRRLSKIDEALYSCYDVDDHKECCQINFSMETKSFEIIKDTSKFLDQM